ncbi:MAG: hypothetical protein P4L22_00200 [Candidatus Babeliales bacterium]|nr:hypothetical protein [Candidatus Babeliales bacterium]
MIKLILIGLILINKMILCSQATLATTEFVYPISYHNNLIYYIHQKSLEKIEFCSWDIKNQTLKPDLLPNCLPGNLTLLPDSNGFSFIDRGKIRIKYFGLEKIKTINLSEPIYNISTINWVDNENFYFSAKNGSRFNIFFVNTCNENKLLTISQQDINPKINSDFLYPQVINGKLFFIERSADERYKTKKSHYKIIKINCPSCIKQEVKFLTEQDKEVLMEFGNTPICFLKMINENEGIFIEHPALIEKTDRLIFFTLYKFYKQEVSNNWQTKELTTFNLPIKYIFGKSDERLYESILPFMPKIYNDKIYYSHSDNEEKLTIDLYSYNLKNKEIKKETASLNTEICFSSIRAGDKIYYGNKVTNPEFDKINLQNFNFIV